MLSIAVTVVRLECVNCEQNDDTDGGDSASLMIVGIGIIMKHHFVLLFINVKICTMP